jgi:hypothetical protein
VIDTGIDIDHPFFVRHGLVNGVADRIVYQHDFPVKATVQVEDGKTLVKLEVPTPHERLLTWGLVKNNRMLTPNSEGVGLEGEMTVLSASYEGDLAKDHSLGLMLAMPNASREFEFNFEDVELP